jgi:hypothetical protein
LVDFLSLPLQEDQHDQRLRTLAPLQISKSYLPYGGIETRIDTNMNTYGQQTPGKANLAVQKNPGDDQKNPLKYQG